MKITLISDTHTKHKNIEQDLPGGDLIIHAGDIMNSGYDSDDVIDFCKWYDGLSQYNGVDAVEEAVLQISVDVFQSRLAAGGTQQALDYTPAPYRMGRTLLYKVTGLISKYIDSNSQVG